jgi:hypothetical protein
VQASLRACKTKVAKKRAIDVHNKQLLSHRQQNCPELTKTVWEVIVNSSTSQWGHENAYTDEVRAKEVGRGKAPTEKLTAPVETFTITAEPVSGDVQRLVLAWEKTKVAVPVKPAS